jgi:5'-3' exonuclease
MVNGYDWTKNEQFVEIFISTIKGNFRKLKKNFMVSYKNIFFVRDCLRETIWRLDLYDKYKTDRKSFVKHKNCKLDLGKLFVNVYKKILPELLKIFNFNIIKVDNAEADDVIFLLTKLMTNEAKDVNIISTDSDFYQLLCDKVKMYEISLKEIVINKIPDFNILNDENYMKNLLLFKILKGDRSDNIKGLHINKKSFNIENIINLTSKKNNINVFIRNRKLIDSNYIPFKIKEKVLSIYKNMV